MAVLDLPVLRTSVKKPQAYTTKFWISHLVILEICLLKLQNDVFSNHPALAPKECQRRLTVCDRNLSFHSWQFVDPDISVQFSFEAQNNQNHREMW